MPPYDPKAKRPKLVAVDDDGPAPVDAILGDEARPKLSVVTPDEPAALRDVTVPAAERGEPAGGPDPKLVVAAVAVVAAVVAAVVVIRRRS